jgi:hypothetical protein
VRLMEISLARDTLKLTPSLATGTSVGANIATPEPAVIRTIVIGTELPRGVDGAPASPREDPHWRGRAGGLGARIDSLLTRVAERFVAISREWFGLFGALASGFAWLEGRPGRGSWMIRPPDRHPEAHQHESDHEELVQ